MKTDSVAALHKQDGYLRSNIHGMAALAEQKGEPRFTSFLDERQQGIAREVLTHNRTENTLFFGGIEGCERMMLGVFPSWEEPDSSRFPICALRFQPKGETRPGHRDYLGSLMGLQIKREVIGDIIVLEKDAVFFLTEALADFVLQNLDRVGRTSVTGTVIDASNLKWGRETREITGTVSSLRLDCVVALVLKKSRAGAVEVIRSGIVRVNCMEETNVDHKLAGGDVLSIRGAGKFILGKDLKMTRKDRIFLTVSQLL